MAECTCTCEPGYGWRRKCVECENSCKGKVTTLRYNIIMDGTIRTSLAGSHGSIAYVKFNVTGRDGSVTSLDAQKILKIAVGEE